MTSSATQCSLDNFQLSIFDITDNVRDSLIKHEFINRNGALMVDMGKGPRTIKFKTYWYGVATSVGNTSSFQLDTANNYVYAQHIRFLDLLEENNSHTFIHPKYGATTVRVDNFNIKHDDRLNYVEIDVELIEDIININNGALPANFSNPSTWAYVNNSAIAAATSAIQQSSSFSGILSKTFSSLKTVLSQVQGASNSVRVFAASVDSNLAAFNKLISDLVTPITSISSSVNNLLDLPTLIANSLSSGVEAILSAASVANTGNYYVSSALNSFSKIGQVWSGSAAPIMSPMWLSLSAGKLMNGFSPTVTTDTNARQAIVTALGTTSFDSAGNLVNTNSPIVNVMTQAQLKQAMNQLRRYTNIAINANISDYSLRESLRGLQNYVNQIQIQLLTTKTITVSEQPLFCVLQALGQDYKNIERILALNPQITNPNFVSGQVTVYV